jgi:hypothetical protein
MANRCFDRPDEVYGDRHVLPGPREFLPTVVGRDHLDADPDFVSSSYLVAKIIFVAC